MKTTVVIQDGLLSAAKELARKRRLTLRALVEEGLRLVLAAKGPTGSYKPRFRTVGRGGLRRGVPDLSWDRIRDLVYPPTSR